MKLYATTTSERASKGQGGNDRLYVDIMLLSKTVPYVTVHINKSNTVQGYILSINVKGKTIHEEVIYSLYESEQKGEKKKTI